MTLAERLAAIVAPLPDGASVTLPALVVREWLAEAPTVPPAIVEAHAGTWRERLWTVPPETRLGVREVAEACDRSADWVYRACSSTRAEARGRTPLPCTRLDGVLCFTAGAVRRWLEQAGEIVNPEPAPVRLATRRPTQ